jgi:iron-sulfur cluster assembly protein
MAMESSDSMANMADGSRIAATAQPPAESGAALEQYAARGVTMTERAAAHVAGFIARRGKGLGLRLGVRTTGCSGMAYKLEYADAVDPADREFESHGVKIFVDPKSLAYIDGTELDFVREGLNEGFQFNNPREKDRCGCGESFRV